MKKLFFGILFSLFCIILHSQSLITKGVLEFEGKDKYVVVLKDSISNVLGIKSFNVHKPLFYNIKNSYVLLKSTKKSEGHLVLRLDNNLIDFEKSKGYEIFFVEFNVTTEGDTIYEENGFRVQLQKGFGNKYISENALQNILYKFSTQSQGGIMTSVISSLTTTAFLTLYATSINVNQSVIYSTGTIGGVCSIVGFFTWFDAYKHIRTFNYYNQAIDLNEINLKK